MKIIQLEEICVSLEEAQELNNQQNAAHAWVFNQHKNFPEFELKPVESLVEPNAQAVTVVVKDNNWKLYNSDVFVAWEQIQELIAKKEFYFAPLKK